MLAYQLFQPFNGNRQVRTALVAHDRMDFVNNQRARCFQHPPAAFARQQNVERLGRRHDNVRRTLGHRHALGRGRVAGAHERADVNFGQSHCLKLLLNSFERCLQIALNVVAERFQWRDVDYVRAVVEFSFESEPDEIVNG